MDSILQSDVLDKLPVDELEAALEEFLEPVLMHLPEKRLRDVVQRIVQGILGSQSPLITQMARGVAREEKTIWPMSKRFYRFMWNSRFSHRDLLKGLYGLAQCQVAQHKPSHLVVALDPVNFEKAYTTKLEGVSTVMKSTPPPPKGQRKRLTSGYPAMTATVVNLPEPVISYASWFSYTTADFISENREIYRSIRITRALFPEHKLRFLGDSGLDDQKIFHQVDQVEAEFIIRASHNRLVEVYNDRLQRWEEELLDDLTSTVPLPLKLRAKFTHARKVHIADIALGWLQIRIPTTQQVLWALVVEDSYHDRPLVLLTNVPIRTATDAKVVYTEWRDRPQIEHTYRFDQEDGLDVEDMRVQTMERMRRVFVMVLLAALFVYHVDHTWPRRMVLWLRQLGGKLGLSQDLDGPYVLLQGIGAVFLTATTLAFAAFHPFPKLKGTYG
ncbi:MAG: hypothetical protein ACK2UA_02310 [Anaerolineae bacterium]